MALVPFCVELCCSSGGFIASGCCILLQTFVHLFPVSLCVAWVRLTMLQSFTVKPMVQHMLVSIVLGHAWSANA